MEKKLKYFFSVATLAFKYDSDVLIEKYIKGEVTLKNMEQLVMNKSLDEEYQKPFLNKPFKINQ